MINDKINPPMDVDMQVIPMNEITLTRSPDIKHRSRTSATIHSVLMVRTGLVCDLISLC